MASVSPAPPFPSVRVGARVPPYNVTCIYNIYAVFLTTVEAVVEEVPPLSILGFPHCIGKVENLSHGIEHPRVHTVPQFHHRSLSSFFSFSSTCHVTVVIVLIVAAEGGVLKGHDTEGVALEIL